jgi:hypothetical protein
MRCRGVHSLANPACLGHLLCSTLLGVAPYCVPGGIRVVSTSPSYRPNDHHELGVELDLGQPGNEPEQGADDDEHDPIRYREVAGERAQARDVHQQSGDQDFSLAYRFRIQDPLRGVVDPSGNVGWKPAIRGQWSGREDDRARRQRHRCCACYQNVTRHLPRRYPMFADLLCRATRVLALQ